MTDPHSQERPLNYAPPEKSRVSALSIVSLSLGIVATPLDFALEAGLLFGVAAVIIGFIALRRIKRLEQRGKVIALTGIILGGVSLLVGITCGLWMMGGFGNTFRIAGFVNANLLFAGGILDFPATLL